MDTFERMYRAVDQVRLRHFGEIEDNPIFIFGNQKSGTTAVAALLAHASDLPVTLDLRNEISQPTFQNISSSLTIEDFVRANKADFCRKIIKEPNLTLYIPELLALYPDSRCVFVVRNPVDNVRSILDRLGLSGNLDDSYREECKHISHAWRLTLNGSWFGLKGNGYIESLAHRWNHIVDFYRRHPETFVLIRYEDFTANKENSIRRLLRSLELTEVRSIGSIKDQQFQKKGKSPMAKQYFCTDALEKILAITEFNSSYLDY